MANVIFKRGLQKDLPSSAQDGVFYLTTDTNRLYVGNGSTKKLLNQTVQIVDSITQLTNLSNSWTSPQDKADHVNDFYYITGTTGAYSNILVVWTNNANGTNQYGWQQINPDTDTFINGVSFSTTATNNIATVGIDLVNNNEAHTTGNFAIQGAGSVTVSTTGSNVLVTGKEYSLVSKTDVSSTSQTEVYLAIDGATASASKLIFSASANSPIKFKGEGNSVFFDVNNTVNKSATATVPSAGSIQFVVTDSDEASVTATVANVGVVLNDSSYVAIADTSGKSAGAIYSKSEIDTLMNGLNGMTYRGTIGTSGTVQSLPTSGVHAGDVYVVSTGGMSRSTILPDGDGAWNSIVGMPTGTTSIVGDMFIAAGVEGADGTIATGQAQWTYIPSGNDSLAGVTYSPIVTTATHVIGLKDGNEVTKFQVGLTAGTDVVLSSETVGEYGLNTTISHATVTTTTSNAASLSSGSSAFTAIKGITVNNGHVTAIETDVFTPVTYDLTGSSVVEGARFSATSTTNQLTATIGLVDSNEASRQSANIVFSSESLVLNQGTIGSGATATNEVIVNLEWGSF